MNTSAFLETAPVQYGPAPGSVRVFIASGHRVFLEGLVRLIKDHTSMMVVGEAVNWRETVEKVSSISPDIAILDYGIAHLSGIDCLRFIREMSPKTKILVLCLNDCDEPNLLYGDFEAGKTGYLPKDMTPDGLFNAILENYTDKKQNHHKPRLNGHGKKKSFGREHLLTKRELEVLKLLVAGKSNRGIAENLDISPRTVETHRKRIMGKLEVHRISELVRYAFQKGIVGWNDEMTIHGMINRKTG